MFLPAGGFFFLLTYVIAPLAICVSLVRRQYGEALLFAVWWIPMIFSAIKDWRKHHFGYESQFSKIWFWGGIIIVSLIYEIFFKNK